MHVESEQRRRAPGVETVDPVLMWVTLREQLRLLRGSGCVSAAAPESREMPARHATGLAAGRQRRSRVLK
jgi:hypothetical protein